MIIEPGIYETGPDGDHPVQDHMIEAYDSVRKALYAQFSGKKGDPYATIPIMLKIIDTENPPLRLFLGKTPYPVVTGRYAERLKTWEQWKDESDQAQGS